VEPLSDVRRRRLERFAPLLLRDEPVVVMVGARTVGKSTLLARLGATAGCEVVDLDDVTVRRLVAADLAAVIDRPRPVLVDEFQHVPELLDAIKSSLNRDGGPGQFLLTGSTRYDALPRAAQSLTGRVHVVPVWPLSQGELAGVDEDFLATLLEAPDRLAQVDGVTPRLEYIERVLAGGLPAVLRRRPGPARARWFADYVALVVNHDVRALRDVRHAQLMTDLLRRLAAQTAQLLNMSRASREVGLDTATGETYVRLLEAVFLIHRIPAWGTTLASRVTKQPKAHLVDTGLGAWLLGLSPESISPTNPSAATEFGHLVETFVVNEVLKQASWLDRPLMFGHYRTADGEEVDLVIEDERGGIHAIEVKAGSTYRSEDVRGLAQLRNRLGPRFRSGVLMYLGDTAGRVGDRLHLVPLRRLWEGRAPLEAEPVT